MHRILNINNYHFPKGGSDSYFLQQTRLLKQKGHSVATFSSSRGDIVNPEWMLVEPPKGIDTESKPALSNVANFFYSKEAKQKLRVVINKFKPDLVHLHIYYGQLTSSILSVISEFDIPTVQTLHEFKLVCPTNGLFAAGNYCEDCQGKNYWRAVLKKCNRGSFARSLLSMSEAYFADSLGARSKINQFIAVSEFQKNKLESLGIEGNKMTVIPHFSDSTENFNSSKGDYFLYVGRIHDDKGIKTLLDAYSLLNNKSIRLKIVGEGERREYWQEYAAKLDLANSIDWVGFLQGQSLNDIYRECLLLINPSYLNETFGLTCLEALAKGKPVIASNVGAFSEVITNGKDGLLFTPKNAKELAAAMTQFINKKIDVSKMGEYGYLKVRNKFSRQNHYEKLMGVYDRLVE